MWVYVFEFVDVIFIDDGDNKVIFLLLIILIFFGYYKFINDFINVCDCSPYYG